MRSLVTRFLLVTAIAVGLTFPFPAAADTDPPSYTTKFTEAGVALTRAAPTLVTEGMSISGIEGLRVTVCVEGGGTLSGAGSLLAYYWDNDAAAWIRNPSLDLAISVTSTSCSGSACVCQGWPDMQTITASGRVLYAPSGITVSAGTTVTVRYKAWAKRGAGR